MGTELLDRSTRPLTVTPAGRSTLDFCRDALHRKEEFEVALERLKQEVEGTVRVASIYSVGLSEMVQLEKEFGPAPARSRLEVEYLRPEKVYEAVLADEADLGLVSYPEPSRDITVIPWRQEEMVLAASPLPSDWPARDALRRRISRHRLHRLRRRPADPPRRRSFPARTRSQSQRDSSLR